MYVYMYVCIMCGMCIYVCARAPFSIYKYNNYLRTIYRYFIVEYNCSVYHKWVSDKCYTRMFQCDINYTMSTC